MIPQRGYYGTQTTPAGRQPEPDARLAHTTAPNDDECQQAHQLQGFRGARAAQGDAHLQYRRYRHHEDDEPPGPAGERDHAVAEEEQGQAGTEEDRDSQNRIQPGEPGAEELGHLSEDRDTA